MENKKQLYVHDSTTDYDIIQMFENMIERYRSTVRDKAGFSFNQSILVNTINSYLMSKYMNYAKNKTRHFFNEMRKVKQDFKRKTHITFKGVNTSINDKAYNYLFNAAKTEMGDDMYMEDYHEDWHESISKFGTAVTKVVHGGKGKNLSKLIPFETFLCDPVNGEKLPAGEVTLVTLHELENDSRYDKSVVGRIKAYALNGIEGELNPHKLSLRRYEIHGRMANRLFGIEEDGYTNGMFVVVEFDDEQRFVLYKSRISAAKYIIDKINPIFGRTMGFGPMEAMLEYQIMTNKLGNMGMDHLEASRIFYQTSDKELDGVDLSEIDHNSLIKYEEGGAITQVSASPQAFGSIQSFMNNVTTMGRESASIQEASLGRGAKSNVSFAALRQNASEADGVYSDIKNKLFELHRKRWKMEGGYIDMCIDYFESGKDIEDLLTPYEQVGFRKFIAKKDAEKKQLEIAQQMEQEIGEFASVYKEEELVKFFLKENAGKKITIEFEMSEIDRKYIKDKIRLTLDDSSGIITDRIVILQTLLDRVQSAPQIYTDYDPNDILMEIMELTDLAISNNIPIKLPTQQYGTGTGMTPTGPAVASENELI